MHPPPQTIFWRGCHQRGWRRTGTACGSGRGWRRTGTACGSKCPTSRAGLPSCPTSCRPPGGCMESFCAFSSSSPTVGRSAGSSRWGTTTTARTLSSFAGVSHFWHARAVIGHSAARAVAQRAKVAGHTLRRPRAAPNVRDALLFPATVPSVVWVLLGSLWIRV